MNSQQYVITYHFRDSACPAIEGAVPIYRVTTDEPGNRSGRRADRSSAGGLAGTGRGLSIESSEKGWADQKWRTRDRSSCLGWPTAVAAHPTRFGWDPNSAKTLPSLAAPGCNPPSTRQPWAPPGRNAADGAAIAKVPRWRRRLAARWQSPQVVSPPVSVSCVSSGRTANSSPISTAHSARRIVATSSASTISSYRRNSAHAPSGVSQK